MLVIILLVLHQKNTQKGCRNYDKETDIYRALDYRPVIGYYIRKGLNSQTNVELLLCVSTMSSVICIYKS